jgi:hypothetical protein
LDQGWEYYSTGQGRIQVVSGQLRLDDTTKGSLYSLNEAILHLNLAGMTNVKVKLDHGSASDENHGYSGSQFTEHVNADLIAVSVNGSNWVKVTNLTSGFTGKTFALDTLLQQAGQAAGSTDRSDVRIKFQQYDNDPWGSDGRSFDNIQVTGTATAAGAIRQDIALQGGGVSIGSADSEVQFNQSAHLTYSVAVAASLGFAMDAESAPTSAKNGGDNQRSVDPSRNPDDEPFAGKGDANQLALLAMLNEQTLKSRIATGIGPRAGDDRWNDSPFLFPGQTASDDPVRSAVFGGLENGWFLDFPTG